MVAEGTTSATMPVPSNIVRARDDDDGESGRQIAVANLNNNIININKPFKLPDGWEVRRRRRRFGDRVDKYYCEPGTGRQFRSLKAVERYFAEEDINVSMPLKALIAPKTPSRDSSFWRENVNGKKMETPGLNSPPAKINWVFNGARGDEWSPFMNGSKVSDSIMQQWAQTFSLSMSGRKSRTQTSCIVEELTAGVYCTWSFSRISSTVIRQQGLHQDPYDGLFCRVIQEELR
ncbi:Methyl-CpG DNA binding [Dillenia turbinata]|uniref:Methyl-CpG DNA binding n=1 Tax=Dillenia turbinata TaxID=194707 RepID=A0AAN8ZFK0_9MAGN